MRIVKLDALRGVAALVVVLQHSMEQVITRGAFNGPFESVLELFFKTGMNFGRFGVAMFFLISGFVIPFSFRARRPLLGFAISRFFRLYPAYWASLAVALGMIALTSRPMPDSMTIWINVSMFQKFVGTPDVVGAYWTLAIELMFYILCAVLFWMGRLTNPKMLFALILLLLASSLGMGMLSTWRGSHLPSSVPLHLAMMLMGTLMRRGWFEEDRLARRIVMPLLLMLIATIPIVRWTSYPEPGTDVFIQPFAFTMGYYVAIALFVWTILKDFRVGPRMTWLGAISYSVYVFHGSVLDLLTTYVPPVSGLSATLFLVLMLAFTLMLSWLVYILIELPFIKIGHWLMAQLVPPRLALPAK